MEPNPLGNDASLSCSASSLLDCSSPSRFSGAPALSISCRNNLISLGLIALLWADKHGDRMPTNYGCMRFAPRLTINQPRDWVCPANDSNPMTGKRNWPDFDPVHASYEIVSPGAPDTETNAVLF